jgi:hypothetical protein
MSTIPAIPKYTILSSSYTTFKETWEAGKNYKLVSAVLPLVETIGEKACGITSKYTGAETLSEIDVILRPTLVSADASCSPLVEKAIVQAEKQSGNLAPVVKVLRKVLPVQTSIKIVAFFYATFLSNLEKAGKVLLLEAPETSAN